ncbi:hypothetical protein F4778DRAFT_462674 [Xylariomycetidae sp. FL2044]|nr:hypothetical protein F4778DRAFT_462674 [Xylariomycetidae sp. FL2044]
MMAMPAKTSGACIMVLLLLTVCPLLGCWIDESTSTLYCMPGVKLHRIVGILFIRSKIWTDVFPLREEKTILAASWPMRTWSCAACQPTLLLYRLLCQNVAVNWYIGESRTSSTESCTTQGPGGLGAQQLAKGLITTWALDGSFQPRRSSILQVGIDNTTALMALRRLQVDSRGR